EGLALGATGVGLHPRYFGVALPVVFLLGARGLFVAVQAACERLFGERATRARQIALALVVLVSAVPLVPYYRYPKQDFLGAMHTVDALAAPNDAHVGVDSTGRVLTFYYHAPYLIADNLSDLSAIEARGHKVWLITTLERLLAADDPPLYKQ